MPSPGLAFVTDLDGTLVDTRNANRDAYAAAFSSSGIRFDADLYDHSFGLNFADLCNVLAPGTPPSKRAEIADRKSALYPDYFHTVRLNHGLAGLLRSASDGGLPVGIATTARRRNVDALLDHFGLTDLFDIRVTAADVDRGKPAPDCYELAARRLGVAPNAVTVFEDSEVGVAAAAAAGCNVIKVVL